VQRGLDALRQYRREYDEKRQVFYEKPLHNWTSHACLDGDSLIKTLRGDVPIRDVVVGDYAWTPAGYALVSASGATKVATAMIEVSLSNGQILLCTPEHKIFTTRGVVVADSLRYNDGVITQRNAPCLLSQKIRFAGYRDAYIESFKGNAIGFGLSETFTLRKLVGDFACFIKRYTERFTAICRAMYDQRTETFATPTPITGRFTELSQNESTPFKRWTEYAFTTNQKGITKPITQNMVASQCTVTFGKSTMEKYQKGFTSITKTETKPTTTYQTLNCCLQKSTCLITQKKARGLVAGQMLKNLGRLAIWLRLGTLHQKGLLGTVKMENAYGKTSRGFLETAMNAAGNTLRRILTGQNSATKIVRLRRLEGAEASRLVYDLTVEKHHCYLANGVLVSNSDAMRYLAVGLREASSTVPIRRALKGIV
jgi:intein/homing endonuclease